MQRGEDLGGYGCRNMWAGPPHTHTCINIKKKLGEMRRIEKEGESSSSEGTESDATETEESEGFRNDQIFI